MKNLRTTTTAAAVAGIVIALTGCGRSQADVIHACVQAQVKAWEDGAKNQTLENGKGPLGTWADLTPRSLIEADAYKDCLRAAAGNE